MRASSLAVRLRRVQWAEVSKNAYIALGEVEIYGRPAR